MRPEDRLQSRARMFLDKFLAPPAYWSSVGHERKQTLRQGQMQKARGIKRGLPDVMVWSPGYFLGIELKSGKNSTTDAQDGFAEAMARNQHGYAVVRSVEQLGEALQQHGIGLLWGWRQAAQPHDAALDGEANLRTSKPKVRTSGAKVRTSKPTRKAVAAGNAASLFMARGGK
jgi:hypothetical protein